MPILIKFSANKFHRRWSVIKVFSVSVSHICESYHHLSIETDVTIDDSEFIIVIIDIIEGFHRFFSSPSWKTAKITGKNYWNLNKCCVYLELARDHRRKTWTRRLMMNKLLMLMKVHLFVLLSFNIRWFWIILVCFMLKVHIKNSNFFSEKLSSRSRRAGISFKLLPLSISTITLVSEISTALDTLNVEKAHYCLWNEYFDIN